MNLNFFSLRSSSLLFFVLLSLSSLKNSVLPAPSLNSFCFLYNPSSFISSKSGQVMPAVVNVMKEDATLVTLVKPQFEARRSEVGSGGIVRDPQVHQEVLEKITRGVENFGFVSKGWIESPIKGAEGNKEFLVCFNRIAKKNEELCVSNDDK